MACTAATRRLLAQLRAKSERHRPARRGAHLRATSRGSTSPMKIAPDPPHIAAGKNPAASKARASTGSTSAASTPETSPGSPPKQFIEDDARPRPRCARHFLIGDDFCFGKGRKGNFAMLQAAGDNTSGFTRRGDAHLQATKTSASPAPPCAQPSPRVTCPTPPASLAVPTASAGVSCTATRSAAAIGFPTANIQLKHRSPPLMGIYTVSVDGLADTTRGPAWPA
jgi:hypothetical protein